MTGKLQNQNVLRSVVICIILVFDSVLEISSSPQLFSRNNFFQNSNNFFNPRGRQLQTERQCNLKLDNTHLDLKTPEIITQYGLPVENHTVTTEDGFSLVLFRIPAEGKPAVFLSHGLGCSSTCFLLNCERRALAIKLADEGFDVWLGNLRGNEYSRKHAYSARDSFTYWNHGFDDIVARDMPLMVDYVLNMTGQARLNWVGHGLGSTLIEALLADRPEYNNKINKGFSLGGTTGVYTEIKHPIMRQLVFYQRILFTLGRFLFLGKALPTFATDYWRRRGHSACSRYGDFRRIPLCRAITNYTDGQDEAQIAPEVLPLLANAYPNEFSIKVLVQWLQWYRDERMNYFNYGVARNLAMYGTPTPPPYNLSRITSGSRITFFWSENDWFTNPKDIMAGQKNFPGATFIGISGPFNHQDFLFGKDADKLVYNSIIERLKDGASSSSSSSGSEKQNTSNRRTRRYIPSAHNR